jgi:hypothetical protein
MGNPVIDIHTGIQRVGKGSIKIENDMLFHNLVVEDVK